MYLPASRSLSRSRPSTASSRLIGLVTMWLMSTLPEAISRITFPKVPDPVRFNGRVLFLTEDAALLRRQLDGEDLPYDPSQPVGSPGRPKLRDNISTDEITPVTVMLTYDERLGKYPYVGFLAGGEKPIGVDAVRNAGDNAAAANTTALLIARRSATKAVA